MLAEISVAVGAGVGGGILLFLLLVGIAVYCAVRVAATDKHALDQEKVNTMQAATGAHEIGFRKLDIVLYWVAALNIKESFKSLKELRQEYWSSERGPFKLAYDVFMATWPKLRRDAEYGAKVIAEVVTDALGYKINDTTDVTMVEAGMRADKIGWPHIKAMANAWAVRDWKTFGEVVRALFRMFMEPNGEIKIAQSVAAPTFAALWGNTTVDGAHATAQAIIDKYADVAGYVKKPVAPTDPAKQAA